MTTRLRVLSERRRTTYCDECERWRLCHKYDAPHLLEEVLRLCDTCAIEVAATNGCDIHRLARATSQETAPSEAVTDAN